MGVEGRPPGAGFRPGDMHFDHDTSHPVSRQPLASDRRHAPRHCAASIPASCKPWLSRRLREPGGRLRDSLPEPLATCSARITGTPEARREIILTAHGLCTPIIPVDSGDSANPVHLENAQEAPKMRCADKALTRGWCHSFNLALPGPLSKSLLTLASPCPAFAGFA